MKSFFCIALFVLNAVIWTTEVSGQVKLGFISGLSPSHIDPGEFTEGTVDDTIRYSITNTSSVWHAGIYTRIQAGGLYLKGAILGGYSTLSYDKNNLITSETANIKETQLQFDLPVEVGINYQSFLVHGGVVWSDFFRPEEESIVLSIPSKVVAAIGSGDFGYRVGLGIDFDWQATLEVNYTYFPSASNRIILDSTADYNFDYRNQTIMVNFSWNFIASGWK